MSLLEPSTEPYIHRACDSCRRKKAKCDFSDSSCSSCQKLDRECTFNIPPGKRGPKGKSRTRTITRAQLHHALREAQASSPGLPY
ncbi:hypothetical protein DER44DRAFT_800844 [Fusarium oxysporum]|nr:hypothetical protein DER44DRAFT_800844 [Fusarium oxysporum]